GPAPGQRRRAPACGCPSRCRACGLVLCGAYFGMRVGGVGGGDHRAAQAGVAAVQHDRLAWRHGTLGAGETHVQGAVVAYLDLAGFPGLAVAHLRAAFETARGGGTADPVRRFTAQRGGLQPRAVVALVDEQHVARHVLADHVPGRLLAPAHAAELEAAALAQGEVEHAGVFAQHPALRIADLTAARPDVLREELAEIALADETDAGG